MKMQSFMHFSGRVIDQYNNVKKMVGNPHFYKTYKKADVLDAFSLLLVIAYWMEA